MNIVSNYFTPNFEARFKLKAPNKKQLLQSAVGTTAIGAGTILSADAAVSGVALLGSNGDSNAYNEIMQSGGTPKAILKSHESMLTSSDGRYDAAGYSENIPVQSTILPSVPIAGSIFSFIGGSDAINQASDYNKKVSITSLGKDENDKKLPS